MIYRQGDEYQGQPAPFDIYEDEDLRSTVTNLVCPQNTRFVKCRFADELDGEPVNQGTIVTHQMGYEILDLRGPYFPIVVEEAP